MFKKFLSIFLTVILLAIIPLSANAEAAIQPRYTYVKTVVNTLSIVNDVANARSSISCFDTVTSIRTTITLQKKVLLWWDDVTEWTDITPNCEMVMFESASVGSGTYRFKMVSLVCAGTSASEEVEGYSNEVKN